MLVERRGKEGWAVVAEDGLTVALDLGLDPELELEGRVRDLIHSVNALRRELGFEIDRPDRSHGPEAQRERPTATASGSPARSSRRSSA